MAGPDVAVTRPLEAWAAEQRWFANAADTAGLEVAGELPIADDVRVLLVRDPTPGAEALYQVPVVEGVADGIPGTDLADGPRSPVYVARLVELVLGGGAAGRDGVEVRGEPLGWTGAAPGVRESRVLSGEQSNTSVIVDAERADGSRVDLIVKVFRALHPGANPDVVLQSAIAAAGSQRVPATYGALVGRWPDGNGGTSEGHLAVAQEFLRDTEDAWRVALVAARGNADFSRPARALGEATAEVHEVLAGAMPTQQPDAAARQATRASMADRAERAIRLVPALEPLRERIGAAYDAGAGGSWPALQRVHGDFHLGQVLLVPERGWVLLDFEGEPLRPMAERSEPDLALRDVAGMLRSFDYVAGTIELEGGDAEAARAWADDAREAFLDGYERRLGRSLGPFARLLTALELDKALYECEYEVRNRPDWLPIPQTAVQRLIGAAA